MASNPPIHEMRKQITSQYPGISWANRVKKMSDGQILATWSRMSQEGKFNAKKTAH